MLLLLLVVVLQLAGAHKLLRGEPGPFSPQLYQFKVFCYTHRRSLVQLPLLLPVLQLGGLQLRRFDGRLHRHRTRYVLPCPREYPAKEGTKNSTKDFLQLLNPD